MSILMAVVSVVLVGFSVNARLGFRAYGFAAPPAPPTPDAWAVLGLPRSATRKDLNRRHRQLAREYRDDAAKLTQINNSYNALKGAS